MFNASQISGYGKLDIKDKKLFDYFLRKFYRAWKYPEDHEPISVKVQKGFLRVDLRDGSWLHVKPNGEWY